MTVSYGIVGCGRKGAGHAKRLLQQEGARVAACCDVDQAAAARFAQTYGARIYPDCREMLEGERLDGVFLCTPASTRLDHVEAAVARGVALYIEKPLAAGIEDGERIAELLETSGTLHTIGFQFRYLDIVETARQIIGDDPVSMAITRWYSPVPAVSWIRSRHLGGGQLVDQAIHLVDLATLLAGPVASVSSAFTQQCTRGEMDNWDGYSTTAEFERGAVGSFYSTYALFRGVGEKPYLDIVQRNRLVRFTRETLIVKTPGNVTEIPSRDEVPPSVQMFHQAVVSGDGSGLRSPVRAALHTLRVVLSATRSAQRHEKVDVSSLERFSLSDLRQEVQSS